MYPILSTAAADLVAQKLRDGKESKVKHELWLQKGYEGLDSHVKFRELTEVQVDVDELYFNANQISMEVASLRPENKFEIEELYAEYMHQYLMEIPYQALQDPAFWRYLALFPFRGYLGLREPDLTVLRYGGGSGSSKVRWLLPRTFIWGRKTRDFNLGHYDRAHVLRKLRSDEGLSTGTIIDFYHSHIVRTAWSANTAVAQSFIDNVAAEPVLFDLEATANRPTNRMASAVARLSNNVLLEYATEKGIPDLILRTKQSLNDNALELQDVISLETED
jgi:hypothetical protein